MAPVRLELAFVGGAAVKLARAEALAPPAHEPADEALGGGLAIGAPELTFPVRLASVPIAVPHAAARRALAAP